MGLRKSWDELRHAPPEWVIIFDTWTIVQKDWKPCDNKAKAKWTMVQVGLAGYIKEM